jgi:hypothetical protein
MAADKVNWMRRGDGSCRPQTGGSRALRLFRAVAEVTVLSWEVRIGPVSLRRGAWQKWINDSHPAPTYLPSIN